MPNRCWRNPSTRNVVSCARHMSWSFSVWNTMKMPTTESPIVTSYEIICAEAQMISYEVTMGLSVVGIFMVFETLKLQDMALAQDSTFRVLGFLQHLFGIPVPQWLDWIRLPAWGVFYQPLGFIMFLTTIMAENKRPPFDLPEGESELIAG